MNNFDLSVSEVEKLASEFTVVPVIRSVFAGSETPVGLYSKLAARLPGSFLLESAEHGVWSRYSFIGINNRGSLAVDELSRSLWHSSAGKSPLPHPEETLSADPLEALAQLQSAWRTPTGLALPPLAAGLVGFIGWNAVNRLENLPQPATADFAIPEVMFALFEDLVIMDHQTSSLLFVANVFADGTGSIAHKFEDAQARLDILVQRAAQATESDLSHVDQGAQAKTANRTDKDVFLASIEQAKQYVRKGDVFQVVLSQRFDVETDATALDLYRALRAMNPSPYMYLLNFADSSGDFAVIGSSPEALVKIQGDRAVTHPIAGSRPRGATPEADIELEEGLHQDLKERAEHLMLVDLARNDLLRVCDADSVEVTEFMQVHKFSHIMHLVSTVEGNIREGLSPVDVFKATFPAGTLSGAPKPRALEIIAELEPANRGLYGGVVGYFDFAGNADLAIAIRTAVLRDGVAHVQAGAGIVLDSDPESEYQETVSKAGAPIKAVALANSLRRIAVN